MQARLRVNQPGYQDTKIWRNNRQHLQISIFTWTFSLGFRFCSTSKQRECCASTLVSQFFVLKKLGLLWSEFYRWSIFPVPFKSTGLNFRKVTNLAKSACKASGCFFKKLIGAFEVCGLEWTLDTPRTTLVGISFLSFIWNSGSIRARQSRSD